uniref:Uncharacterized protein n=1 Tax=Rhizophora mucronata TaxID=61149 RepID=A0A2P2Q9P7_RHIMU
MRFIYSKARHLASSTGMQKKREPYISKRFFLNDAKKTKILE